MMIHFMCALYDGNRLGKKLEWYYHDISKCVLNDRGSQANDFWGGGGGGGGGVEGEGVGGRGGCSCFWWIILVLHGSNM